MKNKILKNSIIAGMFIFVIFGFQNAFAYSYSVDFDRMEIKNFPTSLPSSYISNSDNFDYQSTQYNTQYYSTQNSQNNQASNQYLYPNTTTKTTSTNNSNNTKLSNPNVVYSGTSSNNDLPPVIYSDSTSTSYDNGLTALSVKGSGGFMPSSIWQWILVILLIFGIIVIARVLTKKHTVHEVHHAAPAH